MNRLSLYLPLVGTSRCDVRARAAGGIVERGADRGAARPCRLTLMPSMNSSPKTIDEYLARAKPGQRAVLEKLRKTIHEVAPKVEANSGFRTCVTATLSVRDWARAIDFCKTTLGARKLYRVDGGGVEIGRPLS